jgi:hypothetical protein
VLFVFVDPWTGGHSRALARGGGRREGGPACG